MTLITLEELARGLCIGVFGGAAGVLTLAVPGSPLWLLPAAAAVGGCALTVPEVRQEVWRALPALQSARKALPGPTWRPARVVTSSGEQGETQNAPATPVMPESRPELITTLDEQPHRLIIGHTRGGKTTLIHEMATGWAKRGERVLVADPDAAPGLWPGCEVKGYGDDIASIGEIFSIVATEVEARRLARAQGVRHFEPLHVVVDEAQDVLPVLDGGLELFEDVARRGGKLNIRMTVGVQDKQVSTLGLEGKSSLLRNFVTADVLKTRDGRRVAVLRDPETGEKVTMPIPHLPDPERLIVRRPATDTTQNLQQPTTFKLATTDASEDLLAALLANPVSTASESFSHTSGVTVSVTSTLGTDTVTVTDTGAMSTASQSVMTPAPTPSVRIDVHARAESATQSSVPPFRRSRQRGRGGINVARRRQLAEARKLDNRKATLQYAYAERKAAGLSYRRAYAELGGSAKETREWWHAAPGPREAAS